MKSNGYIEYLKKIRVNNIKIFLFQIGIFLFLIFVWEMACQLQIINTFITSSPSRVIKTIINLACENNLWEHIFITTYETVISFLIGTIVGIIIAIILWYHPFLSRVIDPYLTIFNSLPKVSLGPIFIIWVGANIKSIIVMALLISLIVTIITVYNGFISTDSDKIKLLTSFGANRKQMLYYLVLPYNYRTIISSLKINISMSLIGVIMGELLVSKKGIGYLIMYGSQVFNLDLVMSGIFILCILATILYCVINQIIIVFVIFSSGCK